MQQYKYMIMYERTKSSFFTMLSAASEFSFLFRVAAILFVVATSAKGVRIDSSESHDEHMQPEVHRYTNVVPKDVCKKIIALGEAAGFAMEEDSIDQLAVEKSKNKYSQAIDVMDEFGVVNYPEIFGELEPYLFKMGELIMDQRNEALHRQLFPDKSPREFPELGWIFFRKYSPETPRNSLVPHVDANIHTVNIALNDDFSGGGLFYVKPTYAKNPDWNRTGDNVNSGINQDGIPTIEDHQYGYEWVNSLERENTTDVGFPKMQTGDALIHNFTVWHAVAPLTKGVRYSMVLFFDMPEQNEEEDENTEDEDAEEFDIYVLHDIHECDPLTGQLVLIQDSIDIFWVDPMLEEKLQERMVTGRDTKEEVFLSGTFDSMYRLVSTNLLPGKEDGPIVVDIGQTFQAVRSLPVGTAPQSPTQREVLGTIRVHPFLEEYEFVGSVTTQRDCDILAKESEDEEL